MSPVRDGSTCPGCGLPNYEGLCPHCRGDQDAYERELVPPFPFGSVEHDLAGTCWCQPTTDYEDPVTGDRVFVHRRALDLVDQ